MTQGNNTGGDHVFVEPTPKWSGVAWRERAVKFGSMLDKSSTLKNSYPLSPKPENSFDGSPRKNPDMDLGAFRPDLSGLAAFDLN